MPCDNSDDSYSLLLTEGMKKSRRTQVQRVIGACSAHGAGSLPAFKLSEGDLIGSHGGKGDDHGVDGGQQGMVPIQPCRKAGCQQENGQSNQIHQIRVGIFQTLSSGSFMSCTIRRMARFAPAIVASCSRVNGSVGSSPLPAKQTLASRHQITANRKKAARRRSFDLY